jgi:hypothetical protein
MNNKRHCHWKLNWLSQGLIMKRFSALFVLASASLLLGACVKDKPVQSSRRPGFNPPVTEVDETPAPPQKPVETTVAETPPQPEHSAAVVPPTPAVRVGNPEYGKPVPGKPGLVTSPYSPTSGYIDVHGYPPGAEVIDPYTQKILLVP